ncbi:MAG: hypothetical protein ABIG45_03880 [Bacillota bacterium]
MASLMAQRRGIIGAAYVYLSLPVCIYFIGWLRPVVSVPMTLFFVYGTIIAIRNFNVEKLKTPAITAKQFIIVALMITVWVLLSGIGGFVWQNRFDHQFRNAVYLDLVHSDWPVVNESNTRMLVYYFGFWMPSALIGKAFGTEAGYVFQVIWALIGTGLAFCLMSYVLKKFSWVTMLLFIFFSGLDIIPFLGNVFNSGYPAPDAFTGSGIFPHIELEFRLFNSSSNTTLLFWVYNQTIPFWVGFLLILLQKNNRCLLFTYSLLALFAPLPMLGMLPAVVYIMLRNEGFKLNSIIKHQFNLQNLAGIAQVIIVALFYTTNISAGLVEPLDLSAGTFWLFLYFFMVEFGLYLLWLYPSSKNNKLCIVLMVSTFFFNFVKVGVSFDFAWRATVPFMFFLMIFVMHKLLHEWKNTQLLKKVLIILLLTAGAVTPLMEIARTVHNTAVIAIEQQNPGTYEEGSYQYTIAKQTCRLDYMERLVDTGDEIIEVVLAYKNFLGDASQAEYFNRYFRK